MEVKGRAPSPAQTNAPGLQFTEGSIEATIAGHKVTIEASDWNTIVDTSEVPHNVGLTMDADFHASATSRNRFQYLADRLMPYVPTDATFIPLGIASGTDSSGTAGNSAANTLVAVVGLINPTANSYKLSSLRLEIVADPPPTTLAAQLSIPHLTVR